MPHEQDAGPKGQEGAGWDLPRSFSSSVAFLSVALLVSYGTLVEFSTELASDEHVAQYWPFLSGVLVMILCGFGFLMTFLSRHAYTAVGMNFFASCLVMLVYVVVGGAVHQKVRGAAGRPRRPRRPRPAPSGPQRGRRRAKQRLHRA
jgi:cell division protein FtsW (lipid II flippase)